MNLVIVESPTKARTLSRFLGEDFRIVASMGHIRDLPKSEMGVDTAHDFEPRYVIPRDKSRNVKLLKEEAKGKDKIILATDPDREGEAIAYHVRYVISSSEKRKPACRQGGAKSVKFERIVFHEITKEAIEEALKNPREIDLNLYDAQQARRILDRLVGYRLSPLLWYKIKKGLSAGRVQSVTVRLIVEREREIEAFKPVEYWIIRAELEKQVLSNNSFIANLIEIKGQKAEIKNKDEADKVTTELNKAEYLVSKVETKEIRRFAVPPFTTSTLQQTASNRFGFSAKQTMRLAQDLYEEGYITYHRTDSLNVAQQAITAVRGFIAKQYGKEYLPETPIFYKTKAKGAQEAHEAIRPTSVGVESQVNITEQHQKLYDLIRDRFLASQMKEAIYSQTTADISASPPASAMPVRSRCSASGGLEALRAGDYLFRAIGTVVVFPGWRAIYGVKKGDLVSENEEGMKLPELTVSEKLNLLRLIPEQKFTSPPPRYTEASLIKALEEYGIGRPSTYAPTISTIQDRGYVIKEERKLKPTDMGMMVNDFLVKFFANIVDLTFTARMEEDLDKIATGELKWIPVIANFYTPFEEEVEKVKETAIKVAIPVIETGEKCPQCTSPLVIREGKFGKFVACSTFPKCKYTKNFIEKTGQKCPQCQTGDVVVKHTKRGKLFYGCSTYPKCNFASWQKPKVEVSTPSNPQSTPGV